MSSAERVSAAWADPEGQRKVYDWGRGIFERALAMSADKDLSIAYAMWAGAPRRPGNPQRSQARSKYLSLELSRMRGRVMDSVFRDPESGAWRGAYNAATVAKVLAGEDMDEGAALEALALADVEPPDCDAPTEKEAEQLAVHPLDPLDPDTWHDYRTVKVALCPSGDVGAWAWRMTQVYRLMLARRAMG